MDTHVKVVGVLNIVFGVLGLCLAVLMFVIFGGVAGVVAADGDPDAVIAVPIIGITGAALVSFLVVWSLPGIIVGWGLLKRKAWARIGGIIVAILSLFAVPVGTMFGGYALWVLFSKDTERLFAPAPGFTT
jgi:hypothetical protein